MHTAFERATPFSAIKEVIVDVERAFFTDTHHSVVCNNETQGQHKYPTTENCLSSYNGRQWNLKKMYIYLIVYLCF